MLKGCDNAWSRDHHMKYGNSINSWKSKLKEGTAERPEPKCLYSICWYLGMWYLYQRHSIIVSLIRVSLLILSYKNQRTNKPFRGASMKVELVYRWSSFENRALGKMYWDPMVSYGAIPQKASVTYFWGISSSNADYYTFYKFL